MRWWCLVLAGAVSVWGDGGKSVEEWVKVLREGKEAERYDAVEALANLAPAAVAPVTQLLSDPKPDVRAAALDALGKMGPKAKDAVPEIVRRLKDSNTEVQVGAGVALTLIGHDALPALAEAMKDDDVAVRRQVLLTLGMLGPDALPAIVAAAADEDARVRVLALDTLRESACDAEEVVMVEFSLKQANPKQREEALKELSQVGSGLGETGNTFAVRLKDADGEVRLAAVRGLAWMAETRRRGEKSLEALCASTDEAVRTAAAKAKERILAADPGPALKEASASEDASVQEEAKRALERR